MITNDPAAPNVYSSYLDYTFIQLLQDKIDYTWQNIALLVTKRLLGANA